MPFSVFLGTLSETDETTRILRHLTTLYYHIFLRISRGFKLFLLSFSYFCLKDKRKEPQALPLPSRRLRFERAKSLVC